MNSKAQTTKYRLIERCFERCGAHYILVMMIATRIFGSIGGLLVIYYIELALQLPDEIRMHFRAAALVVTFFACTVMVLLAMWETVTLRRVIETFRAGRPVPPEEASRAGHEAVTFAGRHHWQEAWLVPMTTLVPVLIFLKIADNASANVLMNITLTVFMGISMALMGTFFAVEHAMKPVIHWLLSKGAVIHYDRLPMGRLRFRFGLCSALIIMTTALMIGTLARQRAADIITDISNQAAAVANLQAHSMYITLAAVAAGVVFSQVLGTSVASRVGSLVKAMERVGSGSLTERLNPAGNDEIDTLARRFNDMVRKLELNHQTIQDLNSNLEDKVRDRTRRLEVTLQELRDTQAILTDTARRAGMAEIATGVLHNVGNVLNSINISTTCLSDRLRKSKLADLHRMVGQLNHREGGIERFLTTEGRAEKLLTYLSSIAGKLEEERTELQTEMSRLIEKVGHVKGIVNTQQRYARRVHFHEPVDLIPLIEEIIAMHQSSLERYGIEVRTDFASLPIATLEKTNLVQVLDNLIKNAIEAMHEQSNRVLSISAQLGDKDRVIISVTDTGCGIAPEDLKSIFTYAFTTKSDGNGFGLHSSALAISGIGGSIKVTSSGVGQGATFAVEFPLQPEIDAASEQAPLVTAS
jgi:signal transduction histidine kinase